MEPIRFIHTADLHLGSPLKSIGQASQSIRTALQNASFRTFTRIVDAAIRESVDFVLIAGDLYDTAARSIRVNKQIADELSRLADADIQAFIIAGNHDPLYSESSEAIRLPENSTVFSSEQVETREIRREGRLVARVLGQSYRGKTDSRKMYSGYTVPDTSVWNIGLLHTALNEQSAGYVPCTRDDLLSKNDIHYWALGHIHQQQIIHGQFPVIAYPGIPQGRDVGEQGTGTVLLVELADNSEPEIRSLPVGEIVWQEQTIDIGDTHFAPAETADELVNLVAEHAKSMLREFEAEMPELSSGESDIFKGLIIRWHLKGRGKLHQTLAEDRIESAEYITGELRRILGGQAPFIWTESVQIETGPVLPALDELASDYEFFDYLQSIVETLKEQESVPKEVENELGNIWDASMDLEDPQEDRFLLDKSTLLNFLEDAQQRVIAAILEKRKDL